MGNYTVAARTDGVVLAPTSASKTNVIEVGHLLYWDDATNSVRAAEDVTDLTVEGLNQRYFAARFFGVSMGHSAVADTADIPVNTKAGTVYSFACSSTTMQPGDLFAVDEQSNGTELENATLTPTEDPAAAIFVAVDSHTSAVTRSIFAMLPPRAFGQASAGLAGVGQTSRTLSAALTLTRFDSDQWLLLDPGGADRTITLPAEADVSGRVFRIRNTADALGEDLTIQDDAAATVVILQFGENVELLCNGTSWFVVSTSGTAGGGGSNAPLVETLTGARTLTTAESGIVILDPGGADRNVTLPAEASSIGLSFTIFNAADATGEDLTVRDDTPTTINVLRRAEAATYVCDGTSWYRVQARNERRTVDVQALAGALVLATTDASFLALDPGGADRNVDLPAEASSFNLTYTIVNTADADETLTVREDSGTTTILRLRRGQSATFFCDGTTWHPSAEGGATYARVANMAGAEVFDGTELPIQVLDPDGASRNIDLPAGSIANRPYLFDNTGSGGEIMTIRLTGAGATVATIDAGEAVEVFPTGTTPAWTAGPMNVSLT